MKRFSPGRRVVGNLCSDRSGWLRDVVTIVPKRIGGREIYPAVKHEIRLHHEGATAVRYTGQCAPLPKSP